MMTKIFGAVLIVSGGYFLGRMRTSQMVSRRRILHQLNRMFSDFDSQLREYRRSWKEFLEDNQALHDLLEHKLLLSEERVEINRFIEKIQAAPFRESVEVSSSILSYLKHQCEKIEEDIATTGKALPLVTGAIGLLVAVLLF